MEFNALSELIWIGHAQRNRLIKFDSPLGKDWLVPLQARGTSRIGRDYEFIVDLASSRGEEIKLSALIGCRRYRRNSCLDIGVSIGLGRRSFSA